MPARPSPEALLVAAATGDRDAFAELYETAACRIHGVALAVLRDPREAEEVTREVLLQVWQQAARFDPARCSALAWVVALAHRRAVEVLRGRPAPSDQPPDQPSRPTQPVGAVPPAVAALTPFERSAVELAFFGGHTHTEVSRLQQAAPGTAGQRIRDGLARLRDSLPTDVAGLA